MSLAIKVVAACAVAAAVGVGMGASSAHHFMAEFDREHPIELTGTVSEWQWVNPHTWLIIDVKGTDGETVEWALEGVAPANWKGRGIQKGIFSAGQVVSVMVEPRKDGRPEGGLSGIMTIDGKPGPGVLGRGERE